MRNLLTTSLLTFACLSVAGEDSLSKEFKDSKTKLVIHYPVSWIIDKRSPVFEIVSFPLRQRPPQVLVPPGGAEITVSAAPPGISNLPDWMQLDRVRIDSLQSVEIKTLHFGTIKALRVRNPDTGIPEGISVLYFLTLGEKPIKVGMIYRQSRRAKYFESLAEAIISRLEPTRK